MATHSITSIPGNIILIATSSFASQSISFPTGLPIKNVACIWQETSDAQYLEISFDGQNVAGRLNSFLKGYEFIPAGSDDIFVRSASGQNISGSIQIIVQ